MLAAGFALALGWGCDGGSARVTGPAEPAGVQSGEGRAVTAGRSVTADLRDPFLFDHNARFFGSRTFRWRPRIPIFFAIGDPEIDGFLLQQFLAWERALAGAGGRPLYQGFPIAETVPSRGIFFVVGDLPDPFVGLGDPFSPLAQAPRGKSTVARELRRRVQLRATTRHVEVPEVLASGELLRCVIVLDPILEEVSDAVFAAVVRHEIGHCLGFIGHVSNPNSLMHATSCCPLTITSDVSGMMRRLYRLAPGTRVTR